MKRFLNVFLFGFIFSLIFIANVAKADVMPYYINNINSSSIGVYQATNSFNVYALPSVNSQILFNVSWKGSEYICEKCAASNLFVVFMPKKDLAFLTVVDENDDETWLQISYNQNGLKTGWIKKDDDFRFMNWRTFFNMYGRKYGLYYLKDAPSSTKIMYTSNDEDNQKPLAMVTMPQIFKMQSLSGNWMLAIAYDIDRTQKIGWLRWRSLSGEIYLFPNIK